MLLAVGVGVGCTPAKTVTLRSAPSGATVLLTRVGPEGQTRVDLGDESGQTPTTTRLAFPPDVSYTAEAHRVLCAPSEPLKITYEPQDRTDYDLRLTQFKQFVDGLVYAPVQAHDLWQMVAHPTRTTATTDTTEPGQSAYVDQPVAVTDSQQQQQQQPGLAVDYPSFAVTVSGAGSLMVYEQSSTDSGIPGGIDSRLYKLPLTPGSNPTRLTLNRKQQHNPTFSYSGEEILFDSADNSRTRAPAQFRTDSDESTLTQVPHDADTCQTQYSAGRDALAFTAYSPNVAEPSVMVSSLDGSGATSRGRGMSPQISPDQNRIAFVHRPENGGRLRLATVNVRGPVTVQEIQLDGDHDVADPHWSPDGKLIAYCTDLRDGHPTDEAREPDVRFREPDGTHSFLWLVGADGRNPIQLTHGENFDSHPVFDPDGRTIYFRSNRGGTWNIWKCRLSDAAIAKVTGGR